MTRTVSRSGSGNDDDMVRRARARLYRDPFKGLCERAREERLESCPRCGSRAAPSINAAAPCLFESLSLDLLSLRAEKA